MCLSVDQDRILEDYGPEHTCIMVSKLNPMPFHSVNSPLDDAVTKRLPSGVHNTTLMGCRILFKEVCRCRAGMESPAFAGRAWGGWSFIIVSEEYSFAMTR